MNPKTPELQRIRDTLAAKLWSYRQQDPEKWRSIAKRKKDSREWIRTTHPCDACDGVGETPNGRPCQKCNWKGRLPNAIKHQPSPPRSRPSDGGSEETQC
jgi:hypothetical protein